MAINLKNYQEIAVDQLVSASIQLLKNTSKKKGGSNTARKLRSLKGANPDDSQLYYGQEEIEAVQ